MFAQELGSGPPTLPSNQSSCSVTGPGEGAWEPLASPGKSKTLTRAEASSVLLQPETYNPNWKSCKFDGCRPENPTVGASGGQDDQAPQGTSV